MTVLTDEKTDRLIREFAEQSVLILQDRLIGVYLHGSAVMGCFNPEKSDIDLITVVNGPIDHKTKLRYLSAIAACGEKGPRKGIEISVVLKEVCSPFVYPTPFELHYSPAHALRYREDPDTYARTMHGTDKDLAAHFTVIRKRGICLYGEPVEKVFAEVPAEAYMDSLWCDIGGAEEEILKDPMYITLNLARVLAYKQEGLVLSKQEGAVWAVRNLPAEYHAQVKNALSEYTENACPDYDTALAVRYAVEMLRRIKN